MAKRRKKRRGKRWNAPGSPYRSKAKAMNTGVTYGFRLVEAVLTPEEQELYDLGTPLADILAARE